MKYDVSVIIPCYNAEDTLKRAINSVINQSLGFSNIELLLYDDASTDTTADIIKEYASKYDNIVPILSENNSGRPGKGRNVCIKRASSDYIMFMDNDDEYDKDMCKTLYNKIISDDFDLVSCNYINLDEIHNQKMRFEFLSEKASFEDENQVIFESSNVCYLNNKLIWNCIFKKKIILDNNILFPEKDFAEDLYFTVVYMAHIDKLCYLKNYFGLYKHVQNDSLSSLFNFEDLNNIHDVHVKTLNEVKDLNLDLAYIFKGHVILSLIRLYVSNAVNSVKKEELKIFLSKLKVFEENINLDYPIDLIVKIPNWFMMREKYEFTILYLKLIHLIYSSNFVRKIYRMIFSTAIS